MGALTCERSVDMFGDYVEGVLGAEQRSLVEAHLASCGACTEQLAGYRRVTSLARRATDVTMPPVARARLRRLLGRAWRRHH